MKDSAPLISVLLPAHNAQHSIGAAVKSTLHALPKNAELLIYLDACTDDTEARLSSIHDSRIQIYQSERNIGVAKALNELLAVAKGNYVARMDADDICLPWRFSYQISNLKKTQADFIFTNAILFGRRVKPFGIIPQLPLAIRPNQAGFALVFSNPFVHPSMLSTQEAIASLGGYRNSSSEDYDLWIRAVLQGKKLVRTRGYGLAYRVHPGQLTQQNEWQEKNSSDELLAESRESLVAKEFNLGANGSSNFHHIIQMSWKSIRFFDFRQRFALIRVIGFKRFIKYGIPND